MLKVSDEPVFVLYRIGPVVHAVTKVCIGFDTVSSNAVNTVSAPAFPAKTPFSLLLSNRQPWK